MTNAGKIVLQRDGDRDFDAYLAQPAGTSAPSIIIFTEMFGLSPHNFDMADHYARRGFSALVPNLFWRSQYPGELALRRGRIAMPPGRGLQPSTSRRLAATLSRRSSGCAASRLPTAKYLRLASAPAAAWRSWRRRAPMSMPRCRSTAWASPSTPMNSPRCSVRCICTTA